MTGRGLAVRIWTCAAVLRVLKRFVPLETLVRLVQRRPRGRPGDHTVAAAVHEYLSRGGRFPRRAPGNCLERSLAAYMVLCRAGAAPSLVVGVRRTAGASLDGHVWIVAGERPLGESPAFIAEFAPITVFGPDGRRRSIVPARPAGDLRPA
jgi:hypothetical protein